MFGKSSQFRNMFQEGHAALDKETAINLKSF